jgi:3-hydroxyisobutyrate dehydrogenase-like beta-hydroxyacid dehydrogenase
MITNSGFRQIGFIGLGVMGEPICRNLARKSGLPVRAHDRDPSPLHRLAADGVRPAASPAEVCEGSDIIFLSLPSGEIVRDLARAPGGLLDGARAGQIVVDLGTSAVDTTRELAIEFAARGALFVDAPVARTRAAAEAGTLAVMIGSDADVFNRVRPLIATFASDITLCGPVGCGQVVKILNNMVLFETVVAISEAKAIGERAGVDPALLFDALSKGSADSFALRNHGMKAIVPGNFPERAFSTEYALKDLSYALELAADAGLKIRGAELIGTVLQEAIDAGSGDNYFPVIAKHIDRS